MSAANADPSKIEHGGDVIRMNTIHQKGGESTTTRLLLRRWAKNAQTVNRLQTIEQMQRELRFPSGDVLKTDLLEIVERSAHPHGLTNGGRAGLELVRKIGPGAVIQIHVLNHFSTAKEGRHRLQQGFFRPEETHPGGSTELVR